MQLRRLLPIHQETARVVHRFGILVFSLATAFSLAASLNAQTDKGREDFFESKIRPALIKHCYECHSAQAGEASGGLLLDSQPGMRRGGSRGDVLQGTIDSSLLLKAIQYTESNLEMPPTGKLPQDTINDFRKWIEEGAFDPRIEPTSLKAPQGVSIQQRAESHWAYQPLHSIPVPKSGLESTSHPIDRFILDRLQRENLPLNPSADKATLIRRLYFDLLGLPPFIEEIQAFEADDTSSSYDLLVDRLLSSPHFGERMARYWMDLARYADTKGYVFMEDRAYPHAYRYRDWLIRAWNQDLPYDRFVQLQVAADRLDPENVEGHLDAMGFLTLGRRFLNNPNDIADDRIDVVSRGILGMTVGCARCHDHKYDPISMADYYSLHGAFVNSQEPGGDKSPLQLTDKADVQPSFIFVRGQPGNRGESIERRFVQFLNRDKPIPLADGSGRGDLAKALVDPNNPLTARVFVNRVWGWLFGVPLVDTPSDFGLRSDPPVHRELLDYLALQFMNDGLSTKRLVAQLVRTDAYRRSSQIQSDVMIRDPENRFWWRANRRRMDLEAYRDALLMRAGQIDLTIGGPSQAIHEPPFSRRRTLYAHIDRQNLPEFFRSFDFATPDAHVPRRAVTTVPQQGLFALNSPWILELAESASAQAIAGSLTTPELNAHAREQSLSDQIRMVFRTILAREPTQVEVQLSLDFLNQVSEPGVDSGSASMSRLAWLAQALLISSEFCFVD